MRLINSKIGFIGSGNMAEALIKGLLEKAAIAKGRVLASDISASRRRYIQAKYKIKTVSSNLSVAKNCNIIVLAVKPQNITNVLAGIYKEINSNKIIISIAAGIKIKYIEKNLPACRILRAMPNAPALAGVGTTALCRSRLATPGDYDIAKRIFAGAGNVFEVNEKSMDAVTATSGSGPAYFFLLIDAMINAAVSSGLDRKTARKLAISTAYGASKLAFDAQEDMGELIKRVASKGGTTEAALKVFQKHGFSRIVNNAVRAAVKRSKELSK